MGPLEPLLACGAAVVALARANSRSKPTKWTDVIAKARASPGTLVFPVTSPPTTAPDDVDGDAALAAMAGADATTQTDAIIDWLASDAIAELHDNGPNSSPLHIYSGIYMGGKHFVRATMAMDAIVSGYFARRAETPPTLLYIDTPSHMHFVPSTMAARSRGFRSAAAPLLKLFGALGIAKPTRYPCVPEGHGNGIAVVRERALVDALSVQQGPNYALAKLMQRWRALVARDDGCVVSITTGPPAKTASVMSSATMRFVMERLEDVPPNVCAEPSTVQALMTMVMVRDISSEVALARPCAARNYRGRLHYFSAKATKACETTLMHPLDLTWENAFHGGF